MNDNIFTQKKKIITYKMKNKESGVQAKLWSRAEPIRAGKGSWSRRASCRCLTKNK